MAFRFILMIGSSSQISIFFILWFLPVAIGQADLASNIPDKKKAPLLIAGPVYSV
jgi:hypothetical protein